LRLLGKFTESPEYKPTRTAFYPLPGPDQRRGALTKSRIPPTHRPRDEAVPAPHFRQPNESDAGNPSRSSVSAQSLTDRRCSGSPAACGPAFLKALDGQQLSQAERGTLSTDELFVLLVARRLDRLTEAEQRALTPTDLHYLAQADLISEVASPQMWRDQ